MVDELPVAHAELRALFEHLNEVSGNGYQCDHRLTLTRRFLAERKLPEEETLRWLGANGAGCDCEVILNVAARWGDRVGYVPKE